MAAVVGIDLAWGARAPSGVCVVQHNRVVHSATVRDDREVLALVPADATTVAFDAPIVVPNRSGRRPCDAAVSRCFGRYEAAAYPANRSLPWLAEPRAGRLAQRLGASLHLGGTWPVAVEVYPHAAMVVLFALATTLKYKRGRGRTLASRRAALLALVGHLEGLGRADPAMQVRSRRWAHLVATVDDAARQAALNHVEDELDAYVCAYVALLARDQPDRLAVIGDPAVGAITTPVTPALRACLQGSE